MKRLMLLTTVALFVCTTASSLWAHNVKGAKFYDKNKNGIWDTGEPPISGWEIVLTKLSDGSTETLFTDGTGFAVFYNIAPGDYRIEEILQPGWTATTPTFFLHTQVGEERTTYAFGNIEEENGEECKPKVVAFKTKGFWHNKNGLALLTEADIDYVNSLGPYDFPYDFTFKGVISKFLVAPNKAPGDPCKLQLLQQLLAFIFNVRHFAGGTDAIIVFFGEELAASEIIDIALEVWETGSAEIDGTTLDCEDIIEALDFLNNSKRVLILCPPVNGA